MSAADISSTPEEGQASQLNSQTLAEAPDAEASASEALGEEQKVCVITVVTPQGKSVELPPVSWTEIIPFTLKQILVGFRDSCYYTSYNLEYHPADGDAVVLSDYIELSNSLPDYDSEALVLHMAPLDYSVQSVKVHMKQTWNILTNPRPIAIAAGPETDSKEVKKAASSKKHIAESNKSNVVEVNTALFSAAADVSLKNYYHETLLKFVDPHFEGLRKGSDNPLKSCGVRGICFSGWNPVPPQRKLQGDLCYIDVDTTSGIFTLTAISSGFYLNRSVSKTSFDPRPAHGNAYFSHELMFTILSLCPAALAYWNNPPQAALASSEWTLDNMAVQINGGNSDEVFLEPSVQWTVPSERGKSSAGAVDSSTNKIHHDYDINRAMESFSNSIGLDAMTSLTTPPKEWNLELQAIRATMPTDPTDVYGRAKAIQAMRRLNNEFKDTAAAVVVAILDGNMSAINPGEPRDQQIFIYNNIFFSYAVDTKGSFKLCNGDEACRKMYALDMQNQRYIQSTNISGLNTVLTCIVDYKGFRLVAQSVVPGVLQTGENAARLMYGSVESGRRLKAKRSAVQLMKSLGSALQLAEREIVSMPLSAPSEQPAPAIQDSEQNIRVDDDDEEYPVDSAVIPHIGPVECKIILGTDNKHYLLEVARLTPLDANYVKKDAGGTGIIPDVVLDSLDQSMLVTYAMRQELVHLYRIDYAKAAIMKAYSEASLKEASSSTTSATDVINVPSLNNCDASAEHIPEGSATVASSPAKDLKKAVESDSLSADRLAEKTTLEINPNVFIDFKQSENGSEIVRSKEWEKDEENARNMADFLVNKVIPTVTEDIRLVNTVVIDGESLTKYLHEYGVNLRYLGKVADLAREQEDTDQRLKEEGKTRINAMPKYWLELLEIEMIARSMKHIALKCIQDQPLAVSSPAGVICDLLCYLFGAPSSIDSVIPQAEPTSRSAGQKKKKNKKTSQNSTDQVGDEDSLGLTLSTIPDSNTQAPMSRADFWVALEKRVAMYFNGRLSLVSTVVLSNENVTILSNRIPRLPLLRRVCQQLGVRVAAVDYDFETLKPFGVADITGVYPKVKMPAGEPFPYIDDLRKRAHEYAEKGDIGSASALYQQAGLLLEQFNGNQCKEMCLLNEDFAKSLMQTNQFESALSVLERNLVLAIRTSGLDSSVTLQQHMNLCNVSAELQLFDRARKHAAAAAYIVSLIAGKAHPEGSTVLLVMADAASRASDFANALAYLHEVRDRFLRGGDIVKLGYILQNIADLNVSSDNLAEARSCQTDAYKLFRSIFGENDVRTAEAKLKCEAVLRSNHTRQMDLLQQRQNNELLKKEKERQKWLEDDDVDIGDSELHKKSNLAKKKKTAKKGGKK